MAVTIASGQRLSPKAFQTLQNITSQTTTTATSEAHGQTADPDAEMTAFVYGATATEVAVANVVNLADGIQGQEKWFAMASATGLTMITLSLATHEFLMTSTATETFTATTALVIGAADDGVVGLKFINTAWHMLYAQGVTPATASSPFA